MELGLSLGDASKFLENKSGKHLKSRLNNGGSDICMGLSLNFCAVENQGREESQKSQENDYDDDDDDNGSSENGSSLNMGLGLAAADVSRRRTAAAEEVSSAKSLWSHLSKREFAATRNDVVGGERASDDDENGPLNRKKLRLSKQQSVFLEESFKEHNSLNPKQKLALAKQLNLRPRQVEVWFQNRRARTKLKQTEVDCEYLKKWCEKLSEENRRVQKELQELRALKTSNSSYMQLPPTTLTMCPSCERVSTTTAAAPPPPADATVAQTSNYPNNHK